MGKRDVLLLSLLTLLVLAAIAAFLPARANQAVIHVRDATDKTPLIAEIHVTRGRHARIAGGDRTYFVHWFGWSPAEITISAAGFHEQVLSVHGDEVHVFLVRDSSALADVRETSTMTQPTIAEVRQKLALLAGDFYERHKKIPLDPKLVPAKFRPLIPYAELFGFTDDVERTDRADDAPIAAIRAMVEAALPLEDELQAWFEAVGAKTPVELRSEEYWALMAMWRVVMEADI